MEIFMNFTIEAAFGFILYSFPFLGVSLFCGKYLYLKLFKEKIFEYRIKDKNILILKIISLFFTMIFSIFMIIFLLIYSFFPHSTVFPLWLKILGFAALLFLWYPLNALCFGLGKAVSSGYGSSGKIIGSISESIQKEINELIDKHKE